MWATFVAVEKFQIGHSSSLVLELFWALLLSLVHISNVSELRIDGGVINSQNTSSEMTLKRGQVL